MKIDCPLFDGITWNSGETTTTPGEFSFSTREERHAETMKRAAKVREGQTETVDAAQLIREGREESEERVERNEARREGRT